MVVRIVLALPLLLAACGAGTEASEESDGVGPGVPTPAGQIAADPSTSTTADATPARTNEPADVADPAVPAAAEPTEGDSKPTTTGVPLDPAAPMAPEPLVPIDAPSGTELCAYRVTYGERTYWQTFTNYQFGSNLATDAEGSLYFTGRFVGTVDFGDGAIESHGFWGDSFVAKIDRHCRLVWKRRFESRAEGTLDQGTDLLLNAIALAPSGEILVGGSLRGPADLGTGEVVAGVKSGLLLALDASGETLWLRTFASERVESQVLTLATTADGDVMFAGVSGRDGSFDGEPIGGPADLLVPFVARLDADGGRKWTTALNGIDPLFQFVAAPSGRAVISGFAYGTAPAVGPLAVGPDEIPLPDGQTARFLAALDEDGRMRWGQLVRTGGTSNTFRDGALALDSREEVVLAHTSLLTLFRSSVEWGPQDLLKVDADGGELWLRSRVPTALGVRSLLAIDGQDDGVEVMMIEPGATDADGVPYAVTGVSDLLLEKRDAAGELRWSLIDASDASFWGLITDVQDAIWLGTDEPYDPASMTNVLAIKRLAP